MFEIISLDSERHKRCTILAIHIYDGELNRDFFVKTTINSITVKEDIIDFLTVALSCDRRKIKVSHTVDFRRVGIML